jgi:minor histocompatibility antigen H13
MVSVAKNFDAPIKLLFPRLGMLDSGKRPFSMLVSGESLCILAAVSTV